MGKDIKKNMGIWVSVEGRLLNKLEIITSFSVIFLLCKASPSMALAEAGEKSANAKLVTETAFKCAYLTRGLVNLAIYCVKLSASRKDAKNKPTASPVNRLSSGLSGGKKDNISGIIVFPYCFHAVCIIFG